MPFLPVACMNADLDNKEYYPTLVRTMASVAKVRSFVIYCVNQRHVHVGDSGVRVRASMHNNNFFECIMLVSKRTPLRAVQ